MILLQVAVLVLATLQLGTGQQCELVVVSQDQLREEIRREVSAALEQTTVNINNSLSQVTKAVEIAIENITTNVEELLQPFLDEKFPGNSPNNPANSCEQIKRLNTRTQPGYYWIQTSEGPVVQVYCEMDKVCLGEQIHPASSCKEIKEADPNKASGYYWVKAGNESSIRVYCNMTLTCGGITGGWMQVANIDMTNSSHSCPNGLNIITKQSKRLCIKTVSSGCSSAVFHTHGIANANVCGKVIGYQDRSPDAFLPFNQNRGLTIDDGYVEGVSLTYGANPRKHIWTFAAALDESPNLFQYKCPCSNRHLTETVTIPSWVGNDYFCDSGAKQMYQLIFYPDDPLWDGEGCGPSSTCCSFNNPPWFSKQLPSRTTDDIEMRVCANTDGEDVPIESIELYVQ